MSKTSKKNRGLKYHPMRESAISMIKKFPNKSSAEIGAKLHCNKYVIAAFKAWMTMNKY